MTSADFAQKVAAHHGWLLNPEREFRETVVAGLEVNRAELGYYLCPCRDSGGARELDRDIICPCDYASQDIEEYGQCFCGLYLSTEFVAAEKDVRSIPERRPEDKFPD